MSPERARAILDDYAWMIDTGESPATAATRFGCTLNTLEKRIDRARKVLSDQAGIAGKNATIEAVPGPRGGTRGTSQDLTHSLMKQRAG